MRTHWLLAVLLALTPRVERQVPRVAAASLLVDRRYTGAEGKISIGAIAAALLSKDTTVYVLDQENNVIHVARGSAQARLLSRKGNGPAEMQRPNRMSFFGDSIALPDATLRKVTIFSLRGRGFQTKKVESVTASGYYGVEPVAYGRSALVLRGYNVSGLATPRATSNDVALFVRLHGSSELRKLAHLSLGDIRMEIPVVLRGSPATMPREQPFAALPVWDWGRDGAGVVVIDTVGRSGASIQIRVRQWRNDGHPLRTCALSRPQVPLSNPAYEAGLKSLAPPPGTGRLVQVDWTAVRRLVARPASLPPFRSVRLASDGTVWIRT